MTTRCPCAQVQKELGYIGERNQQSCFQCRLKGSHHDSCSKCCLHDRDDKGYCRRCGSQTAQVGRRH